MIKVKVLYTKKNFSPFDYMLNGRITERVYNERNDEFVGFKERKPSIEFYEVVGEHEFSGEESKADIFDWVIRSYNAGSQPQRITEGIRSGKLNVGFSSFSTGCVIQIEGCYYISNGMTFDLLPLEFSGDE